MAMAPREHVEWIRKTKFSIGGEENPLTEDLHQAVKNLSAELYAKDVHFLMELIQNAEDNEYLEGVDPSLELVITSSDITATGALATLLIFNNEKGFSPKNIESICSVGRSTKKGHRKRGYIGEKGIGFKSVFLITAQPYIFSNGYQIRFNEEPCPQCGVGYIVPEWVENPTLSDIKKIYGSRILPTTTIILPLKPDKVKPVKQQLSSIHPELLLFLSKIKCFSVKEDNKDPRLNTVSAISISSETDFVTRKNIDAESYTLHLSAEEKRGMFGGECSYYMWKQKFPVRQENIVERRREVEEWVITLAFPNGERLSRGMASPGVYAFLPTEIITNFPFIIQADFLLPSSRETILWDDKWNQGILDCVSSAFVNAIVSLVKMTEDAPVSSLPRMFQFLPVNSSSHPKLNDVRESIKSKLVKEDIVPSESYTEQKFFHKPCEVGRLIPTFWNILKKAREERVSLHNLSSHGRYILNASFDKDEYDDILNFLGVELVDSEWYTKCIQGSNLVMGVSENLYLELLLFLANNWSSIRHCSNAKNIPLIKYLDLSGNVSVCSISEATQQNGETVLFLARQSSHISWLIDWNKEFRALKNHFFMPKSTLEALRLYPNKETVLDWLITQVTVVRVMTVYNYAVLLNDSVNNDRKLVIAYAHFLCRSLSKNHISDGDVKYLCSIMPLVDNYGHVSTRRKWVLVPANGSKWAELIGSNPWREEGYVELGEAYMHPGYFAGESTPQNQFMDFLKMYIAASDIPFISPPNSVIPTVSGPLQRNYAFLLLDWIQKLNYRGIQIPDKFLTCIKVGSWMKVTLGSSHGYRPPVQSFLPSSSWGNTLQNGSVLVDIPLIDQSFYGDEITKYKSELKTIGVMFEFGDACRFIGKHLMSLAASSSLTRSNVFQMLNFIKLLRDRCLAPDTFICSVKGERWLRTTHGYRAPVGSVLLNEEWKAPSQISDIPFIDQDYYGEELLSFKTELQLLGVLVGFSDSYKLVVNNLKSPSHLACLTAESVLFIVKCLSHLQSSNKLVQALKDTKCLKTNIGYKSPGECFLFDPEWGCLLNVFNGFPFIDNHMYGSWIYSSKNQLKQMGVQVDFEEAAKAFAGHFRQQSSISSISKENVLSFLACFRNLKGTRMFPSDFKSCIRDSKWLRTRLGYCRSPKECILFGPDWEHISLITRLPFIDESYYGKDIDQYKKELQSMGVIVELKDGVEFVATDLFFPENPCSITPASTLSLLKCIQLLIKKDFIWSEAFLKKISQRWLKTYAGYMSPKNCLMFNSGYIQQADGPFIDVEFYGSSINSYSAVLNAVGVTIDVKEGCPLIASYLDYHSKFTTIVRIYNYLCKFDWKPNSEATRRIWIPNGSDNGEWVSPEECVLCDKDGLFGSQFNVLEKFYEVKLLNFFSNAFDVKSYPSVDDYCELWKVWESSGHKLSHAESCAFWRHVSKHFSSKTERTLAENLVKLPVDSSSNEILLFDKRDVFIADDLQLKDLFEQSSSQPIFVWYPQSSLPSLTRTKLLDIYRKIGVRTISESVQMEELSLQDDQELKQVSSRDVLIPKDLIKLILGFLADPSIQMEAEKRQEAVKCLFDLTILETVQPIAVSYSLTLSTGKIINVKASKMIRWDREASKLFTQNMDRASGHKNLIEYATYFSEVISEGVLWEKVDHISALSELIKLGFLMEFNEEAVNFLMKSKNLQIFMEDEKFLSSASGASNGAGRGD